MENKSMPVLDYYHQSKLYPDLPEQVSFGLLDEQFAMREHGQTLSRLAERGGLSVWELYHHIRREDMPINSKVSSGQAATFLINHLKCYHQ